MSAPPSVVTLVVLLTGIHWKVPGTVHATVRVTTLTGTSFKGRLTATSRRWIIRKKIVRARAAAEVLQVGTSLKIDLQTNKEGIQAMSSSAEFLPDTNSPNTNKRSVNVGSYERWASAIGGGALTAYG